MRGQFFCVAACWFGKCIFFKKTHFIISLKSTPAAWESNLTKSFLPLLILPLLPRPSDLALRKPVQDSNKPGKSMIYSNESIPCKNTPNKTLAQPQPKCAPVFPDPAGLSSFQSSHELFCGTRGCQISEPVSQYMSWGEDNRNLHPFNFFLFSLG